MTDPSRRRANLTPSDGEACLKQYRLGQGNKWISRESPASESHLDRTSGSG
jgi:hypothetical protein